MFTHLRADCQRLRGARFRDYRPPRRRRSPEWFTSGLGAAATRPAGPTLIFCAPRTPEGPTYATAGLEVDSSRLQFVKLAVLAAKTVKNSGFLREIRRTQSDRSSPLGTVENRVGFALLLHSRAARPAHLRGVSGEGWQETIAPAHARLVGVHESRGWRSAVITCRTPASVRPGLIRLSAASRRSSASGSASLSRVA